MILLDTNVLLFDALFPEKLSTRAKQTLKQEHLFSCSDISLLEIAMVIHKKRIIVDSSITDFIDTVLAARNIKVLPITPAIAELSQTFRFEHKDPADLVIAATALHHNIPVITADGMLKKLSGLQVIW